MGKVIVVTSGKGGVGKTTSTAWRPRRRLGSAAHPLLGLRPTDSNWS